MYPGAAAGELAFTVISGGRISGRVRNALACPGLPGAAEARVREVGSQPTVPVSAIPAAPAESAPRNLRRVIVPPSLPPHSSAKSALKSARRRKQPQEMHVLRPILQFQTPRQSRETPLIFPENPQHCKLGLTPSRHASASPPLVGTLGLAPSLVGNA